MMNAMATDLCDSKIVMGMVNDFSNQFGSIDFDGERNEESSAVFPVLSAVQIPETSSLTYSMLLLTLFGSVASISSKTYKFYRF